MKNRLSRLRSLMAKRHLDAVLVSSVPNITYLTGFSNFSKDEREAFLFIVARPQGSARETSNIVGYILTDARYSEAVRNKIKNFELVEISPKITFERILKDLVKKHKIKKLGIEESNLTVKEHKTISKHSNDTYHYSVGSLRIIKDRGEIKAIEKACKLGDKTFDYILNKIKEGITEKELAFEIEFFIKKQGADISFPPIVAFGANSAIPHHVPTNNKLTNNQIVLLDLGVKLNDYCSDMTRTVYFGVANAEYKKIYQTVLDAQKRAIEHLKFTLTQFPLPSREKGRVRGASSIGSNNKIMASEVDKVARSYIISQGYPTIPHSLGHGVGIEVHESPRLSPKSKDTLKPGMVFTIEPGIYIPNFGGVRIEDVVVLEKTGPRILTYSPKQIIELKTGN